MTNQKKDGPENPTQYNEQGNFHHDNWIPRRYYNKSHKEIVTKYMELVTRGIPDPVWNTSEALGISTKRVKAAITKAKARSHALNVREEFKQELYKERLPLAEQIIGLSMTGLRDRLHQIVTDPDQLKQLTIQDLKSLKDIGTGVNEFLRLELGKSTENVEINTYTHKNLQVVIQDLSKVDKVFNFEKIKELPEPDELHEGNGEDSL